MFLKAKIIENKPINNEQVYCLKLQGDFTAFAGQFYLLSIDKALSELPRPFSVYDLDQSSLSFCYQVSGCGTKKLSEMIAGEQIKLRGPYGKALSIVLEENTNKEGHKKIALVAGGVGCAPFLLTAKEFFAKGFTVDLYAGFSKEIIPLSDFEPFCQKMILTVENDNLQSSFKNVKKGLITDFFLPLGYDAVFTCGPKAMMKVVCEMSSLKKVPVYALLEANMACGVGVCRACVVKTINGNKDICRQGPVLSGEEIIWDGK